jgi:hypothetical protein
MFWRKLVWMIFIVNPRGSEYHEIINAEVNEKRRRK